MKVAIYLRQSMQREGSVSIEMQQADCESYCERQGYQVVGVWVDLLCGSNSRSAQRPQYRQMLAAAATWDVLLVWKLDRVGRQELEFHRMIADLDQLEKGFAAATEDIADPLMRSIKIAFAAQEARDIGRRSKRAKSHNAEKSYWPGTAPFGTRRVHTPAGIILERDPETWWIVETAIRRVAEGEGLRAISRWVASTGTSLSLYTIRNWFFNDAFAGRVVWDGGKVDTPAQWEPLLDPKLIQTARQRLTNRYHVRPRKDSLLNALWIHGLCSCAGCGSRMPMKTGSSLRKDGRYYRYPYLYCGAYPRGLYEKGCAGSRWHSAVPVQSDALVQVRAVLDELADPVTLRRELEDFAASRTDGPQYVRDQLLLELKQQQAIRQRTVAGYLSGALSDADARDARMAAEDRIAELERDLAAAPIVPTFPIDEMVAFLSSPDWLSLAQDEPPLFREAIKLFVQTIQVPGPDARCRVVWRWA